MDRSRKLKKMSKMMISESNGGELKQREIEINVRERGRRCGKEADEDEKPKKEESKVFL